MKNIRLFHVALLLFCALLVQDSRAQDENPFNLPEGARARLGKGRLSRDTQSVAYSPDGTRLAVASSLGIWLYDARTYTEVALLTGHTSGVASVTFTPDGKTIASVSEDRTTVWLWDADSGTLKTTIEGLAYEDFGGSTWVYSVAFTPDGKTIAVANGREVLLLDMESILARKAGGLKAMINIDSGSAVSLAFAPDGKTITIAIGYRIWLLDMESILVLASDSKVINQWEWDADSGVIKTILEGYMDGVSSMAFSPDGKTIASASGDGTIRLWNAGSGALKTSLKGQTGAIYWVMFSPDGKTIASAGNVWTSSNGDEDLTVSLWDTDRGTRKATLKGQFDPVAFSPDGKTIASNSGDGIVSLWDTDRGTRKATLKGHTNDISSVVFSPDGKTIASAGWDPDVLLWDADRGTRKATLKGHTDSIYWMAFSPDGKTIASKSYDGGILLWDADRGTPRKATLERNTDWTSSVMFSPDGKTIASSSYDGGILLWDMSPYLTPSTPTAVQSAATMRPTKTTLLANFPNPFNPDTYIPYQLHAPAHVRLTIYDVRGALVREIDVGYRAAGPYLTSTNAAHWDGRDHGGQHVASGVYLYRLQAGPVAHVRKMVLVK